MAEEEQTNGWFQRHVIASFDLVNSEIALLRASMSKVHERIDSVHQPPCSEIINVKGDLGQVHNRIGKIETILGLYKWLVGGMVLSLIGLVVSLLLIVAKNS